MFSDPNALTRGRKREAKDGEVPFDVPSVSRGCIDVSSEGEYHGRDEIKDLAANGKLWQNDKSK